MRGLWILLAVSSITYSGETTQKSPAVVIIGGGPAGLAAGIEAARNGCSVTIIEKRTVYSRNHPIAITKNSERLLKKWNVFVPGLQFSNAKVDGEDFSGICRIYSAEKSLAKKCEQLGVRRVQGEFLDFSENQTIKIRDIHDERILPYDLLIGADGFHSRVRERACIPMQHFGIAKVCYVVIPDLGNGFDVNIRFFEEGTSLIKIVESPVFTTVLMHDPLDASLEKIRVVLQKHELFKELQGLERMHFLSMAENVPVALTQAEIFYDFDRSVAFIGDSIVSASFIFGNGLNSAFSEAELIGRLIKQFPEDKKKAFYDFNESMQQLTNEIVNQSKSLHYEEMK